MIREAVMGIVSGGKEGPCHQDRLEKRVGPVDDRANDGREPERPEKACRIRRLITIQIERQVPFPRVAERLPDLQGVGAVA